MRSWMLGRKWSDALSLIGQANCEKVLRSAQPMKVCEQLCAEVPDRPGRAEERGRGGQRC